LSSLRFQQCSHEHLKEKIPVHSKLTFKLIRKHLELASSIEQAYEAFPNQLRYNNLEWRFTIMVDKGRVVVTYWRLKDWDEKGKTNLDTLLSVSDKTVSKALATFLWHMYCKGMMDKHQVFSLLELFRSPTELDSNLKESEDE